MTWSIRPIHQVLIESAGLAPDTTLLDLGCGQGPTLLEAVRQQPSLQVFGIDRRHQMVATARRHLGHADVHSAGLMVGDLEQGLPLRSRSVDAALSHNVLECVPDPGALINEAARVLRRGGVAVWSHIDFDGLIINTTDPGLGRHIIAAFSDHALSWMRHVDGRMGRQLAGLVHASAMELVEIHVHTTIATGLEGHAAARVEDVINTLGPAAERGGLPVTTDDVESWAADLRALDQQGRFFFAEPTVVAVSKVPDRGHSR
jgi:ubiquinone/menaquinone biosynthesis C-methylase UbiE